MNVEINQLEEKDNKTNKVALALLTVPALFVGVLSIVMIILFISWWLK